MRISFALRTLDLMQLLRNRPLQFCETRWALLIHWLCNVIPDGLFCDVVLWFIREYFFVKWLLPVKFKFATCSKHLRSRWPSKYPPHIFDKYSLHLSAVLHVEQGALYKFICLRLLNRFVLPDDVPLFTAAFGTTCLFLFRVLNCFVLPDAVLFTTAFGTTCIFLLRVLNGFVLPDVVLFTAVFGTNGVCLLKEFLTQFRYGAALRLLLENLCCRTSTGTLQQRNVDALQSTSSKADIGAWVSSCCRAYISFAFGWYPNNNRLRLPVSRDELCSFSHLCAIEKKQPLFYVTRVCTYVTHLCTHDTLVHHEYVLYIPVIIAKKQVYENVCHGLILELGGPSETKAVAVSSLLYIYTQTGHWPITRFLPSYLFEHSYWCWLQRQRGRCVACK